MPPFFRISLFTKGNKPHIRTGKASNDFVEAVFLHQCGSLRRVKPFGLSLLLLRPIIELGINPEREDTHLTKPALVGQLLFIVEHAERPLADNVTDQAGLLVGFLACDFGWLPPFYRPTLRDYPSVRIARGQQQDLTPAALADSPGQSRELNVTKLIRHAHQRSTTIGRSDPPASAQSRG